MTPTSFVILTLLLNATMCITVLFRKYNKKTTIPLFGAGVFIPLTSYFGIQFLNSSDYDLSNYFYVKLHFAASIVSVVCLSYIANTFLRNSNQRYLFKKNYPFNVNVLYLVIFTIGIVLTIVLPLNVDRVEQVIVIRSLLFDCIIFFIVGLLIFTLYSLEKTWHYAHEYQRRIARLFFIPMVVIVTFNIIFYTAVYIYHSINPMLLQANLIIQGVTFPILLTGFFRYRIGNEQVTIPRNTVYSSISLFLSGAAFLGIGTTLYLFKLLKIDLEWFESTLLIFTCTFLLFLLVSSGNMRRRITRFVNSQFYSNKYEYRDQFFRLHQAYLDSTTLDNAVVNLVENIKYAVTATDAHVLLRDPYTNSFTLRKNPEFASVESITIPANDPVILAFEKSEEPIVLNHTENTDREKSVIVSLDKRIAKLSPTNIFPIMHNNTINGILLVVIKSRKLDTEDNALITVFTQAIGSLYFKNYQQQKEVESGQFQSFNQVVSFVVHDLKNQIATLSLLAKNADMYIDNQEFQKSLIRSIRTCSDNLTSLTEKLSKSRKGLSFNINEETVLPILEKVVMSPLVQQNSNVEIRWEQKEYCTAPIDKTALEQVFVNIIKNAIEAMDGIGSITLYCRKPDASSLLALKRFNLSGSQIENYSAVVCIEDTGCGMSSEFVETKLFKPFETTKDKGIGIGVYQCKTYIEKMNGKLLCSSQSGMGTAFCILL